MTIQTRPLTNDEAFDRWCRDLVKQAVEHRSAAWTIGDLLLEGLEKFDEARVWTAAEATGMTPETLTNYKSLAKTFRPGRRRMNLGISVHETVRSLDETAQNLFLDMVEKHEISREALRDRVRAYKAGDAGAANYKWRPERKVIDVDPDHAGVSDDDKPVMDGTSFGQGMAAEKAERERGDESLSDANQILMRGLDTVERALNAENRRMLPLARLNSARLRAAAAELTRLADEADVVQSGRMTPRHKAPASTPTPEATADGEADGTLPRTASPDIPEAKASEDETGTDARGAATPDGLASRASGGAGPVAPIPPGAAHASDDGLEIPENLKRANWVDGSPPR